MNKNGLISELAARNGMTKKEAEAVLESMKDIITETLAKGEKIQIVGFGTFEVKERAARMARNPRTGEQIKVEASKALAFKAGKELKDAVSGK